MDIDTVRAFSEPRVAAVFDAYPDDVRARLLALRALILAVAVEDDVGPIEETLKWGQPSYLTRSGSGTTIRIDQDKALGGDFALFVNCQTTLVDEWRDRFPDLRLRGRAACISGWTIQSKPMRSRPACRWHSAITAAKN